MMGRVVRPGDQVTIGGFTGEVVDVTWRSTMVRDKGGKVEVIPNSVLNKTALTRETDWSVTDRPVEFYAEPGSDLDAVTREVQDLASRPAAPRLPRATRPRSSLTPLTPTLYRPPAPCCWFQLLRAGRRPCACHLSRAVGRAAGLCRGRYSG